MKEEAKTAEQARIPEGASSGGVTGYRKPNEKQGTSGVPLKEIVITFCQDSTTAKLDIKDDITPIEAANFSILMAQAAAAYYHGVNYAWIDFIKEKGIERHFSVTEA